MMNHPVTTDSGQQETQTIGVIAVLTDKGEDVTLVFKFASGLSKRELDGAAKKLHEMASGLEGLPPNTPRY
jgi:hypothetical protein